MHKIIEKLIIVLALPFILFGCEDIATIQPQTADTKQEIRHQTEAYSVKSKTIDTKERPAPAEDGSSSTSEMIEMPNSERQTKVVPTIKITNKNAIKIESNGAYYINGKTSNNCSKIIVQAKNATAGINDKYTLTEYSAGSTIFRYGLHPDWDNLGPGMNNYVFTAYCDGNIKVSDNVTFYELEENESGTESFIKLNDSASLTRSENKAIYVQGETSPNCSKITVEAVNLDANVYDPPYELKNYKKGDTSFEYGVREDLNNLGEGQNNYYFKAYCDNGRIETATYVITTTASKTKVENPISIETSDSSTLSNDNYYTNVDGNRVHSPAYSDTIPSGASARCKDGTYSFSQNRRGTCSGHGGVARWL